MAACGSENIVIPSSFRGLRVLLVDHNFNSLTHNASIMEHHSYRVTATERATVALSMIQKEKEGKEFDLILVDVNMVEMDCFKFIKEISQYNLPIVVMAAREEMYKVETIIRELGEIYFISKPCGAKSILNVWQYAHRIKRNPEELKTADSSIVEDTSSEQNSNAEASGIVLKPTADYYTRDPNERSVGGEVTERKDLNMKSGEKTSDEEKGRALKKRKKKSKRLSSRMRWTPDLHLRFMEALNELGEEKAHPKALLRKMNVPFLTHRHVASHLQKHRARVKRQSKNTTYDQLFTTKSILNNSITYGSTPSQHQDHHPNMFMQSETPMTRPWLNAKGSAYLTLNQTLQKDQLETIGASIPTWNTGPQTYNHDYVLEPKIGNEKLSVVKFGTHTNTIIPEMFPIDNQGGLVNSNHLSMQISDQVVETKNVREFEEAEAMEGTRSSVEDFDPLVKFLEGDDYESLGHHFRGDDIDRYSQHLLQIL